METLAPNRARARRGSGPVWRELHNMKVTGKLRKQEAGQWQLRCLLVFLDDQCCAKYYTGTDFKLGALIE